MTEPAAPSRTRVFLHIGCRKSGTTSLQRAFRISVAELAEQGVNLPYPTREEHIRHQVRPVREFLRTGSEAARARAETSVAELAERIRAEPEMTHLLTLETLAEWPKEGADILVGGLAEFEVHVVVTARHWVLTIPSEWQQGVKSRLTISYADLLAAIRDRTEDAAEFLAMQDVPAIVQRWGALLPREQVHVVACPPRSRTEGTLVELFCGLVGIDPDRLNHPKGALNQGISLDQAELLRRINAELGDRLTVPGDDYDKGVRGWIVRGSMMKQSRPSIRIPQEYVDWAVQEAHAQYDALRGLGVDIVGRAEDLLPDPEPETGPVAVDDDAVAAAAVTTLADLADQHYHEVQEHQARLEKLRAERDRLRAEVERLRAQKEQAEEPGQAAQPERPEPRGWRERIGRR